MKSKKVVKVLVIADFAALTKERYNAVLAALRKQFPTHIVIPRVDEAEKDWNEQSEKIEYKYYVCFVERTAFNGVSVRYQGQKTKQNYKILDIAFSDLV